MGLCYPHDGFNGAVGLSFSHVVLQGAAEEGLLPVGLETTETLVSLHHSSGGPPKSHLGIAPVLELASPGRGARVGTPGAVRGAVMGLKRSAPAVAVDLRIPKLRKGSYFSFFGEPRRTAEKALIVVIQEACVQGISTRTSVTVVLSSGRDVDEARSVTSMKLLPGALCAAIVSADSTGRQSPLSDRGLLVPAGETGGCGDAEDPGALPRHPLPRE
jgi:hypothetical protein